MLLRPLASIGKCIRTTFGWLKHHHFFLLQWDAVFLLSQPFPFAWSFFFCIFLQVLPASLEMLQRLSCTTRTREAYKYLDGILYAYYCFLIVLIIIIQSSGKREAKKRRTYSFCSHERHTENVNCWIYCLAIMRYCLTIKLNYAAVSEYIVLMHLRNYNFLIGKRYVEETVAFPIPATIHFMIKKRKPVFLQLSGIGNKGWQSKGAW